jgi:acetolactate synthase-1/2/3 large subunit
MKATGARLTVQALEKVGVTRVFGIPGVHVIELFDELASSSQITPILTTHEGAAAFAADGVSRTSREVGTLVVVPGAGITHAMSGIAEARLDGIPMVIISGGIRRDSGRAYQLHDIDQERLLAEVTKSFRVARKHEEVIPAIYEAYQIAVRGEPGPAVVEIPAEVLMFEGRIQDVPPFERRHVCADVDAEPLQEAVELLMDAKKPGIYVGWGAVDAHRLTAELADTIVAPVATTLQGLSAFPAQHPMHTGVGFGPASVPAGRKAFDGCDCLLTVGARFSEVATGSYGLPVPEKLIHVDINPAVFDRNYPASVRIAADASVALEAMLEILRERGYASRRNSESLVASIARWKKDYLADWLDSPTSARVSPARFFAALRKRLGDDALMVVDDGKHTFLAAELFPVRCARGFISPTDFNCMGYAVPSGQTGRGGGRRRRLQNDGAGTGHSKRGGAGDCCLCLQRRRVGTDLPVSARSTESDDVHRSSSA